MVRVEGRSVWGGGSICMLVIFLYVIITSSVNQWHQAIDSSHFYRVVNFRTQVEHIEIVIALT